VKSGSWKFPGPALFLIIKKFKTGGIMKIIIPLMNENELSPDFNHSKYIGLYDYTKGSLDLIQSEGIRNELGYTAFFDSLSSQGVKAVVCLQYNVLSLRIFRENNLVMYVAESDNLSDNIRWFEKGHLQEYQRSSGGCGTLCSSCSSGCN
jgi:predicted Fe-Mo cluster-binding NifX family protein